MRTQCARCRATRSNAKKKLFSQNEKSKNSKIERLQKAKKQKAKRQKRNFAGNFELWKTDRGSKDATIFSVHLAPSRSPVEPAPEMPRIDGTLDVPGTSSR
jgi:hypothetical protein